MKRKLPAYPLFLKDPNFSLWSFCDDLTAQNVKTWYGEQKPTYGFVKTNGKTYCFLGEYNDVKDCNVLKAEQIDVEVTSFTTNYLFDLDGSKLRVSFVSPLPPNDVTLLSLPACYMEYDFEGEANAEVSLFVKDNVCFNANSRLPDVSVRGGVVKRNGYEAAFVGLKRQYYLSNNFDGMGADWGYFHLAGEQSFVCDEKGFAAYLSAGNKNFQHASDRLYMAAVGANSGRFALAYDDIVSIDYYGKFKKTAYLETHTIYDALDEVMLNASQINAKLDEFDKSLKFRAEQFGSDYYDVLVASLRQSVAAHKLVCDDDGKILFLSKECFSNGCIATVDITYPSSPLYLLYNPELVKGMMRPILKFAKMSVWKFDFAPHDAGTYPACCGQAYGLKCDGGKYQANYIKRDGSLETHFPMYLLPQDFDLYDVNMQMPVEECANMLIMFAACYKADNDISFFAEHSELCGKWAEYLVKYGLKPENQLCTDDFAGHLANNLNLAIKAAVAIGAYAQLLYASGNDGSKYANIAESYANQIADFSLKSDVSPLTWNGGDTYSLKYNLAFDGFLKLNLFPQSYKEREVDFYIAKQNKYGTPLDSRKSYTKSDWICWAASLTKDKNKAAVLIKPLKEYLTSSPTRVPFCDWYDTLTGAQCGFQARSVQGGCFALLLKL